METAYKGVSVVTQRQLCIETVGVTREDESTVDFRLVAYREKKENQTDQSNLP